MVERDSDVEMLAEDVGGTSASISTTESTSSVHTQDISIFGAPRVLNEQKLPSKLDVLRRLF